MIEYKAQLNLGNEAFGTEKTITANEAVRTADASALAREIHHQNSLIPEDVAAQVLAYFCKAAAEKMSEGFAIQLKSGEDVALRIFPDIHVKGGNINLERAKQLDPSVTELTKENAGRLIDLAGGVTVRVRATVMNKFTELLEKEDFTVQRVDTVVAAYVERKDEDETTDNAGTNSSQSGQGGQGTGTIDTGGTNTNPTQGGGGNGGTTGNDDSNDGGD